MPQIFDEAGREKVRTLLLESGFELIKNYGLKKTSISDITRRAGVDGPHHSRKRYTARRSLNFFLVLSNIFA